MDSFFCSNCQSLLVPNPVVGKLKYKCDKCGELIDANPENTILISEDTTASEQIGKYKHTISATAFDPISSKIMLPDGCEKCGRKIASYQLLGEKKTMVTVCLCGHTK